MGQSQGLCQIINKNKQIKKNYEHKLSYKKTLINILFFYYKAKS